MFYIEKSLIVKNRLTSNFVLCIQEYELRKIARTENRRYCDTYALTYQAERMPEQIRMKVVNTRINYSILIITEKLGITKCWDTF